jgi:SAM-dependent methyltransferase
MSKDAPKTIQSIPEVPDIFKSIMSGASMEQVALALYGEMSRGRMQGVWIGLRYLQQRGDAGLETLSHISRGNDQLAIVAKALVENVKTSGERLEQLLGIKRWGESVLMNTEGKIDFTKIHAHAVARGFTTLTPQAMYAEYVSARGSQAHIKGTLGSTVFTGDRCVGASVPTYLELLGPIGVLGLRNREKPTALLLGTFGPHSSDDFGEIMRHINPTAEVHALDINPIYAEQAHRSKRKGPDQYAITADARSIPYPENYFNVIATNFLFNFISPEGVKAFSHAELIIELRKIFQSAYDSLVPGGSFLVVEDVFRAHKSYDRDGSVSRNEMLQIAKSVGFRFDVKLSGSIKLPLPKEWGSVPITAYGFGDYTQVLALHDPQDSAFKLVKQRS